MLWRARIRAAPAGGEFIFPIRLRARGLSLVVLDPRLLCCRWNLGDCCAANAHEYHEMLMLFIFSTQAQPHLGVDLRDLKHIFTTRFTSILVHTRQRCAAGSPTYAGGVLDAGLSCRHPNSHSGAPLAWTIVGVQVTCCLLRGERVKHFVAWSGFRDALQACRVVRSSRLTFFSKMWTCDASIAFSCEMFVPEMYASIPTIRYAQLLWSESISSKSQSIVSRVPSSHKDCSSG